MIKKKSAATKVKGFYLFNPTKQGGIGWLLDLYSNKVSKNLLIYQ